MRCKKCGKRIKNKDYFCTECGYYNGDFNEDDFDTENNSLLEETSSDNFKELNDFLLYEIGHHKGERR